MPNCPLTSHADDIIFLTDGVYSPSDGVFWTHRTTVGWQGVPGGRVSIEIDLGSVKPISGISFSTAGRNVSADIGWPPNLHVLVSSNRQTYYYLGDLVMLSVANGIPPRNGYSTHRYWTRDLEAHGRYVMVVAVQSGYSLYTDEIEVYEGNDDWIDRPIDRPAVTDPLEHFSRPQIATKTGIQARLREDCLRCRIEVERASLDTALRRCLNDEIDAIIRGIEDITPVEEHETYRPIFPLNELHERIYAVMGTIAEHNGLSPLDVWTISRWDPIYPDQKPTRGSNRQLSVSAMREERRAAVVNLTNCTAKRITAKVRVEGIYLGKSGISVEMFKVNWTDTPVGVPIASALSPIAPDDLGFAVCVPAGMTQQVWIELTPSADMAAGLHAGTVSVETAHGKTITLPVNLRVIDEVFPKQPTLHLSGWDKTNRDTGRGLTADNIDLVIAHLKERFVDSPWAIKPFSHGTFDKQGRMLDPPDTASFDRWIGRWRGARRYMIVQPVGARFTRQVDSIDGLSPGTAAFDTAVGEWIAFWVQHARKSSISPEQIVLHLVDEPHTNVAVLNTLDWAKPIKRSQPGVRIFTNPTTADLAQFDSEFWDYVDIVAPLTTRLGENPGQDAVLYKFLRTLADSGKQIELYDCSGPFFSNDPYSYYRLQAWRVFDLGGTGTSFWSFVDTRARDKNSWNVYLNKDINYCMLFIGPDSVTGSKHMEAIRESIQDYEYMVLLRDRIRKIERENPDHVKLDSARQLLHEAPRRVIDALSSPDRAKYSYPAIKKWAVAKDRSVADAVLEEIASMLETLR